MNIRIVKSKIQDGEVFLLLLLPDCSKDVEEREMDLRIFKSTTQEAELLEKWLSSLSEEDQTALFDDALMIATRGAYGEAYQILLPVFVAMIERDLGERVEKRMEVCIASKGMVRE